MKKRSIYDDVCTFVVRHVDTRLFGTNNFHFRGVLFDWDKVYESLERYWGYEEMSRKRKPVVHYYCDNCGCEIIVYEKVMGILEFGVPMCTDCSRWKREGKR